MAKEVELKFLASAETAARAPGLLSLGRFRRVSESVQVGQEDTYFDTAAGDLAAAAVSFRRRVCGDKVSITFKGPRAKSTDLVRREEIEEELSPREGLNPKVEPVRRALEHSGGAPLIPVLHLVTRRATSEFADGNARVRLDVDGVTALSLGREVRFWEIELEDRGAGAGGLREAGDSLLAALPALNPSRMSKLPRARDLLGAGSLAGYAARFEAIASSGGLFRLAGISPPVVTAEVSLDGGGSWTALGRLQSDAGVIHCRLPVPTGAGTVILDGVERTPSLELVDPEDVRGRAREATDLGQLRLWEGGLERLRPWCSPARGEGEAVVRGLRWLLAEWRKGKTPESKALTGLEGYLNTPLDAQFPVVDQTNPLAELSSRRGVTVRGAAKALRHLHPSHYGRLCPLETPESKQIGLSLHLARGAFQEEASGEIAATLVDVRAGSRLQISARRQTEECRWIASAEDAQRALAAGAPAGRDMRVLARHHLSGEVDRVPWSKVTHADADPGHFLSWASSLVPFIQHDDAARAMMGGKNMKQALPLVHAEPPLVRSGTEEAAARETGRMTYARRPGVVTEASPDVIRVVAEDGSEDIYRLAPPRPTTAGTPRGESPAVAPGQAVRAGQPLTDAAGIRDGVLALGINLLVAYMPFFGLGFEDGIVVSESAARRLTAPHLYRFRLDLERRPRKELRRPQGTPAAPDGFTYVISEEAAVSARELLAEGEGDARDRPSRLVYSGTVRGSVKRVLRWDGAVEVWVQAERPLEVGDKLTGRHGNKGVVSRILPDYAMPHIRGDAGHLLPVEAILNPLGVVGRMNLGQLYETECSWLVRSGELSPDVGTAFQPLPEPVRSRLLRDSPGGRETVLTREGIEELKNAGVLDATQGERLLAAARADGVSLGRVTAGFQYFLRLNHLAREKLAVRATGLTYSPITGQPVRGRRRAGGQRLGEMEVWALLAHGAHALLKEALGPRSDQSKGRKWPGTLDALEYYLRGLGIVLDWRLDGRGQPSGARLRLARPKDVRAWAGGHNLTGEWGLTDPRVFGQPKKELARRTRMARAELDLDPPLLNPLVALRAPGQPGDGDVLLKDCMEAEAYERLRSGLHNHFPAVMARPFSSGGRESWLSRVLRLEDIRKGGPPEDALGNKAIGALTGADPSEIRGGLDLVEAMLRRAGCTGCWIEVLPIIPLAYRTDPERGRHPLNVLYAGVLQAVRGVRNPRDPEPRRSVYWALARLLVFGAGKRRPSLLRLLDGKEGLLRWHLLGKRQEFSGRAVIVPDPALTIDQVGVPARMLACWLRQDLENRLNEEHGPRAQTLLAEVEDPAGEAPPEVLRALSTLLRDQDLLVLVNRAPTLHKYNLMAFRPVPRADCAVGFPPMACEGFNADFDGDTVAVHLPRDPTAQREAHRLLPSQHLQRSGGGGVNLHLGWDLALGWWSMSPVATGASQSGGQAALAKTDKWADRRLSEFIANRLQVDPASLAPDSLRALQRDAFEAATLRGGSLCLADLQMFAWGRDERDAFVHEQERKAKKAGEKGIEARAELAEKTLLGRMGRQPEATLTRIVSSRARGDPRQIRQMVGAIGRVRRENGTAFKPGIGSSFLTGLSSLEYWMLAHVARRTMIDKKLGVARAGGLTRDLVEGLYEMRVAEADCGTTRGLTFLAEDFVKVREEAASPREAADIVKQAQEDRDWAVRGRVPAGVTEMLRGWPDGETEVTIRSPVTCEASPEEVCPLCYGADPGTGQLPSPATLVGIVAGESIGERGTQLTMRTFHSGGAAMDIGKIRELLIRGMGDVAKSEVSVARFLMDVGAGVYERAVAPVHFELALRRLRTTMHLRGGLMGGAADPARGVLAAASYRDATILVGMAMVRRADSLQSAKSAVVSGRGGA